MEKVRLGDGVVETPNNELDTREGSPSSRKKLAP